MLSAQPFGKVQGRERQIRKVSLAVIVLLLIAVVGYLAIDRSDELAERERAKAFDANYAK